MSVQYSFMRYEKKYFLNLRQYELLLGPMERYMKKEVISPWRDNRFGDKVRDYRVADVKVDGRSVGAATTYSFTNMNADHKVEVTFAWKAPYDDVIERYIPAVEFVTEAGVMGAYSGSSFSGTVGITADDLVCALAELSDTAQVLSDANARRAWITANGIAKGVDLTKKCDVQTACTVVVEYLKVLEAKNGVTFLKLDKTASVKDATVALNLATAKTFDANRLLNRYDLAAICRLIARLEYR